MSIVIRAAARTLPPAMRDRYREQWLADARDARENGLRPASIAVAALTFAATYERPLPSRPVPSAEQSERRSRLALGLALSAALLSLSQYPRVGFSGLTSIVVWDFVDFFLGMLLLAYAVLAPIVALVWVRGLRARWAVALLALATTAPVVAALGLSFSDDAYLRDAPVFAVAALLIAVACGLLWRPTGSSLRAPIVGAVLVWAVTALGVIYGAVIAWPARTPLNFGEENAALYEEWIRLKLQFEALVTQVFWVWAIAGFVLGVLVFVVGRRLSERDAAALVIAATAISLLGASGVFGLLELGMSGTVPEVLLDPLRLIVQVLLVAVVLVAVGGVRFTPANVARRVPGQARES